MFWNNRHPEEDTPEMAHQPISRAPLSPQLQHLLDRDDGFYDDVYTPYSVDSTETPYRYAGYANRLRTILLSAHRYVAYTSDIGESFRPVAHPYLVRTAYGISWSYILGDVAHEGYKAYLRNRRFLAPPGEAYKDASDLIAKGKQVTATSNDTLTPWPTTSIPLIEDYRVVMAQRAVFQSIASMGLPALTIHSVVKYTGRMLKNQKSALLRTWTPIGLGLSVVPFLPYLFDEPVEEAIEWCFHTGLRLYGGEDAVRHLPPLSETQGEQEDPTSLSHFLKTQVQGDSNSSSSSPSVAAAASISWDEYREELRQAREQRKRERQERGHSGPLSFLGLGGFSDSTPKSKTE